MIGSEFNRSEMHSSMVAPEKKMPKVMSSRFEKKIEYSAKNKLLHNPNYSFMKERFENKPKQYSDQLSLILKKHTKDKYEKPDGMLYLFKREEKVRQIEQAKRDSKALYEAKKEEKRRK